MDLAEFLQTVPTFAEFNQAELDVLERALRVDRFPAGHVFFKEGQKGHSLYILMEGEVQVSRRHKIERGVDDLGVLKSGEVFGLQALIDDQPRYSTCRAATAVTVASLPKTAFNLLFNAHISLAEHFQYMVARQLVRELRRVDRGVAASAHAGDAGTPHHLG
jgi:CRP/FNR family cyclic AMP-dependent transcriptional regulator